MCLPAEVVAVEMVSSPQLAENGNTYIQPFIHLLVQAYSTLCGHSCGYR